MRRDRDGSELEDAEGEVLDVAELRHELSCRDGWLGDDTGDRLVPCRLCRPHLAGLHARLDAAMYGPGRRRAA